jgi:ribonuclease HII
MRPLLEHVSQAAGTDEAGRGPLAGPVVAAAVILPDGFDLTGIQDSKLLKEKERLPLEKRIQAECDWSVVAVDPEEIDQINILRASLVAMARAVVLLSGTPTLVLVDGHVLPTGLPCPGRAVIKGDSTYACIAAASILAKSARDRTMRHLGGQYPGYGFEEHFGYPTPQHFDALRRLGPCPIHRKSFSPVRDLLQAPQPAFDEL